MTVGDDFDIPETGAVFTFGRSRFADNVPSKFWIKNDLVVEIACGDEHTAVITGTGRLFMIGSNDMGQLGLGSTKAVQKPSCVKALKPEKALHVACGRAHTIVACSSGAVYTWGYNGDGQLGTDDQSNHCSPVLVMSLENAAMAVAAGSAHSVVLAETGELYVWGSNTEGQLGLDKEEALTPTLLSRLEQVVGITCGYYHTAAVTENGQVYTWGDIDHGKLGLADELLSYHRQPNLVELPEKIIQVAAGSAHTLFLSEGGTLYSCGLGSSGELGQGGSILESWLPQPVVEAAPHVLVRIASGGSHTAAITDNGLLLTWGCGRHGKLCQGEENFASRFNPTVVRRLRHISVILVGCGGCHTMVLGCRRVETEADSIDNQDNEVPEHNSSVARARRRVGDGVLPPLKSSSLPAVKHLVLPTVPDTEAVSEKYEEQNQDQDDAHTVTVDEDCTFNDVSAEGSDSHSDDKEEDEPKEISEEEPDNQSHSSKKGNRLTRLFGALGKKKSHPIPKDVDDDVEVPVVPVSPESHEQTIEYNESDLVSDTENRETEKVVTPVEQLTIDRPPSGDCSSSVSVSRSSHKNSKACVIV